MVAYPNLSPDGLHLPSLGKFIFLLLAKMLWLNLFDDFFSALNPYWFQCGSGSTFSDLMTQKSNILQLKKKIHIFQLTIAIYLSLVLHEGLRNHRRKVTSKQYISWLSSFFVGHFWPSGSGPGHACPMRIRNICFLLYKIHTSSIVFSWRFSWGILVIVSKKFYVLSHS